LQTFTDPISASGGPAVALSPGTAEGAALHRLLIAAQLIEEAGQMLCASPRPGSAEALLDLSLRLSDLEMALRGEMAS
jgi:hypothetical protein